MHYLQEKKIPFSIKNLSLSLNIYHILVHADMHVIWWVDDASPTSPETEQNKNIMWSKMVSIPYADDNISACMEHQQRRHDLGYLKLTVFKITIWWEFQIPS